MSLQTVETDVAASLAKIDATLDELRKVVDEVVSVASLLPAIGPFAKVAGQIVDALDDLAGVAAHNAGQIAGIKQTMPTVVIDAVPPPAPIEVKP